MLKSNPELHNWLRFYQDLGIEDLYLPATAPMPSGGTTPKTATTSHTESVPQPVANPAAQPPPESSYRAPSDLFTPEPGMPQGDPLKILSLIQHDIGDCTRCKLHSGRTNLVFGVGNPKAKVVFVGEGPGADEDAQGIPFVGRAGQLLTQMINNTAAGEGIPIQREDVYICNVVKCRPPGNRAPEPDEMQTCGQFLERQLEAIRPKAICVLGGTAAKYLLQTSAGITKLRGEWQEWRGIPVMPTFHPSFLLRGYNQTGKRQAWEDLKKLFHYVYD